MKKLLMLILFVSSAFAQKVYVISNEPIQTNQHELEKFFLAKTNYINGTKYHRISNQEALDSLASIAYSLKGKKLSKQWIKQNFRKGTPFPLTLKTDEQTIQWINTHEKTVGFVEQEPQGVSILFIFEE